MSSEGEDCAGAPGLVPKLRFPGFREAGPWTRRTLGMHLHEHTGRVAASTEVPVYSSSRSGLTPQGEYFDGSNLQNFGEYSVVPQGYITFRHMSDDGIFKFNQNLTGGEIAVSKEYPVFTTKGISIAFLLNILNNSYDFRTFALSQKKGGTRTRLYLSALRTWEPLLPPEEAEQHKIADCLSSLDDMISAEGDRLAALKGHKKGLMQALFPAPGQTTPRRRFPEFVGKGEWDEKPIGEICDLYQPETLSTSELSEDGEYLVFGANGVIGRHSRYNHEFSEVAVTCRGATCGEVLQTVPKSWITGNAMVVRPKAGQISKDFLFQLLKFNGLQSVISGSAQPQITRAGFAPLPVLYPKSGEQQRIVDCLSALDQTIDNQGKLLIILKSHKLGLMQQLFPTTIEASA